MGFCLQVVTVAAGIFIFNLSYMNSAVGTKSNIVTEIKQLPLCCKETQGNAVDIITCLSIRAHYNQPLQRL